MPVGLELMLCGSWGVDFSHILLVYTLQSYRILEKHVICDKHSECSNGDVTRNKHETIY